MNNKGNHVKRKTARYILCLTFLLGFIINFGQKKQVQAVTVLPTDVKKASKGCILVGASGTYVSDIDQVLTLLNRYRWEACKNGYINPDTGKPLTRKDYKPLKWSYDLEYIARIRVAEVSVSYSHERPNGDSWSSLLSPNKVWSSSEILAGSWSNGKNDTIKCVKANINLWYQEKPLWITYGSANSEAGHFATIIRPSNLYVGISSFVYGTDSAGWMNFTCGEFSGQRKLKSSKTVKTGDYVQKVEIKKSLLKGAYLTGASKLKLGKTTTWKVNLRLKKNRINTIKNLKPTGRIKWSSSNPKVAKVDAKGKITAVKAGTVTIKAVTSGYTAIKKIEVVS